ncbi:MAG: Rne/Rng family ribonuclease [Candidatus Binatia bacterium]|jgi:ribonuclease E
MSKTMLINMTHAEESRVGIVTDGVLTSFEIESASREHLKGNIYKGVVRRIHPALEAAFVDIGAGRDAFLPLDEICFRNLPDLAREGNGDGRRRLRIKDVLKPGQEVLVQIAKEEFGNKPPTLSTFYSLPGRYLVLLPGSDEAGISRRIEGAERTHMRELLEKLQPPEGFGIIVRTAAGLEQSARELHRDLSYLMRLWETIRQAATTKMAPTLVYREHDVVLRNIRDYFTPDIDQIYVDNEEVFQRAREFLHDVMPGKEDVLHLYEGDQPIFSHFNVESQIESIYKRRVPLKSGGSIVIDGTEALTAVDVNSGRSVRGSNQEETAFRTNIEAATEIARQLRLRDLGGLIVIDFIDMRSPQHISDVEKAFREAMRQDKARHETARISHFGLLEVSRQRLRPAAAATSYTACPMCEGHGLVRTTESAALVALRKAHNRVSQGDTASLTVSLPPEVAVYLLNHKRDDLAQLERRYATRIQVALKEELMPHQSEMEIRTRLEPEQAKLRSARLGGVAVEPAAAAAAVNNGATGAPSEPVAAAAEGESPQTGKRRRRRRGRRRGRGRQAAAAIGEALVALGQSTSLIHETEPQAAAGDGEVHVAASVSESEPMVSVEADTAPATEINAATGPAAIEEASLEQERGESGAPAAQPKAATTTRRKRAGAARRGARTGRGRKKAAERRSAADTEAQPAVDDAAALATHGGEPTAASTEAGRQPQVKTPARRTTRRRSASRRSHARTKRVSTAEQSES